MINETVICHEPVGNENPDNVSEEWFEVGEKDKANERFFALKATPGLQNITMYQVVAFVSVSDNTPIADIA